MLFKDGDGIQFASYCVANNGGIHKLHDNTDVVQSKQFWNLHTHCPLIIMYGYAHLIQRFRLLDEHCKQFDRLQLIIEAAFTHIVPFVVFDK